MRLCDRIAFAATTWVLKAARMAGHSWMELAWMANSDPMRFHYTIRDPASVRPGAKMPPHSDYDDATLDALTAYFKTFAVRTRGASPRKRCDEMITRMAKLLLLAGVSP